MAVKRSSVGKKSGTTRGSGRGQSSSGGKKKSGAKKKARASKPAASALGRDFQAQMDADTLLSAQEITGNRLEKAEKVLRSKREALEKALS